MNEKARKYNIYNNMQCPLLIGTPSKTSFTSVVETISNNMTDYLMAYPLSGVQSDLPYGAVEGSNFYAGRDFALGSNYFVDSGSTCDSALSESSCKGKKRMIYVRNIPTGKIPLLGDISFQGITGCNIDGVTEGRGLFPGLLEDISDISPIALGQAVFKAGNVGSQSCKLAKYPVGSHIYDPLMECRAGEDCSGKTWEMQSQCTSSTHHMKKTTDSASEFEIPGAPGFFDFSEGFTFYDDSSSRKSNPRTTIIFLLSVFLFLFAVLFFVEIEY